MLDTIIYSTTLPTEGITAGLAAPFWLFCRERRHGHTLEPTLFPEINWTPLQRNAQEKRRKLEPPQTIDDRRTLSCCSSMAESKLGSNTNWEFQKLRWSLQKLSVNYGTLRHRVGSKVRFAQSVNIRHFLGSDATHTRHSDTTGERRASSRTK